MRNPFRSEAEAFRFVLVYVVHPGVETGEAAAVPPSPAASSTPRKKLK